MKRKNRSDVSQETLLSGPDEKTIRKEKDKARKLRQTAWWQKQLDKGKCHYCGNKFSRKEFTMDHVVPLSRGGTSTKGNIVVCCKECNNQKKSLTPVEMLLSEKFKPETNVDTGN